MERQHFINLMTAGAAGLTAGIVSSFPGIGCAGPLTGGAAGRKRPNIVLILCDDLGYSDIGCYGGEIKTPNLDQLAVGGMLFTQFYNGARCCPTRASLLTGLYAHQAGVGHMTGNEGYPEYQGYLNRQCATIAELLKSAGYQTYMSGKWHVGDRREAHPQRRGFDEYFGLIPGVCNYFRPGEDEIWDGDQPYEIPADGQFYTTDAFTDYAVKFIDRASRSPERPFFLYLAYTAPHYPLQAWPEDIKKYRGSYRKGWDQLRQERHKRLLQLGLLNPEWVLSARDNRNAPWDSLAEGEQDWRDQLMATYAAMVDRMDQGIGKVLTKLGEVGADDNTLILFLSDNGACPYTNMWGDRPRKDSQNKVIPVGGPEALYAYGWEWANAGNAPFRKYKRYTHEGGISTPMIACWPGVIQPGSITHRVGHIIDVMPTCLAAAGAEYPRAFLSEEIKPLEGMSLLPVLQGKTRQEDRTLFWEHMGHRAVRKGQWKLVADLGGEWELYDLQADRTETNNLVAAHPEKVKELRQLYDEWTHRCGVMPWSLKRG